MRTYVNIWSVCVFSYTEPRVLAVGGKWALYMFVKIQQQYNIEVMLLFFFVCLIYEETWNGC